MFIVIKSEHYAVSIYSDPDEIIIAHESNL